VSDLDNRTLLLSVKTFTGRPPAIRRTCQNGILSKHMVCSQLYFVFVCADESYRCWPSKAVLFKAHCGLNDKALHSVGDLNRASRGHRSFDALCFKCQVSTYLCCQSNCCTMSHICRFLLFLWFGTMREPAPIDTWFESWNHSHVALNPDA
jgi:hypothetical protein